MLSFVLIIDMGELCQSFHCGKRIQLFSQRTDRPLEVIIGSLLMIRPSDLQAAADYRQRLRRGENHSWRADHTLQMSPNRPSPLERQHPPQRENKSPDMFPDIIGVLQIRLTSQWPTTSGRERHYQSVRKTVRFPWQPARRHILEGTVAHRLPCTASDVVT